MLANLYLSHPLHFDTSLVNPLIGATTLSPREVRIGCPEDLAFGVPTQLGGHLHHTLQRLSNTQSLSVSVAQHFVHDPQQRSSLGQAFNSVLATTTYLRIHVRHSVSMGFWEAVPFSCGPLLTSLVVGLECYADRAHQSSLSPLLKAIPPSVERLSVYTSSTTEVEIPISPKNLSRLQHSVRDNCVPNLRQLDLRAVDLHPSVDDVVASFYNSKKSFQIIVDVISLDSPPNTPLFPRRRFPLFSPAFHSHDHSGSDCTSSSGDCLEWRD